MLQGASVVLPQSTGAIATDSNVPEGHKGLHGFLYGESGAEVHDDEGREYQTREVGSAYLSFFAYTCSCGNQDVIRLLQACIHPLHDPCESLHCMHIMLQHGYNTNVGFLLCQGEDDGTSLVPVEQYLTVRQGEKPLGVYALYDSGRNLQYVGYARNMTLAIKVLLTVHLHPFSDNVLAACTYTA